MEAPRYVDWVAKLALLEGYRQRDGLGWGAPRLTAIDIQWSDVRSDRGLANRMSATGRFEQLVTDEEVTAAMTTPPEDTRAWFRGACLERFPNQVVAASWDSVIVEVPGQSTLQRIPMMEPLRGTKAAVGELVRTAPDMSALVAGLAGPGAAGDTGAVSRPD